MNVPNRRGLLAGWGLAEGTGIEPARDRIDLSPVLKIHRFQSGQAGSSVGWSLSPLAVDEQVVLECLATLSLLARWVDQAVALLAE